MSIRRFLLSLTAVLLTAVTVSAYEVVLLGDLHFDRADVHDQEKMKPYAKKELARNLDFWEKTGPQVIAAAATKIKPATAFTVQLGDIVQGDTDTQDGQESLLRDIIAMIHKNMKPLATYVVKGNHDHRCPGNGAAFEKIILPTLQNKRVISGPNANYALLHQEDLYLFLDSEKPDHEWVLDILKRIPKTRHVFFISHLPVIPVPGNNPVWVLFRISPKNNPARLAVLDMMAKRNVIVLSAHLHRPTWLDYKSPAGRITQVTVNSMATAPNASKFWKQTLDKYDSPALTEYLKKNPRHTEAIEEYRRYVTQYHSYRGAGYAVLRIDGKNVYLDNYAGTTTDKPVATWKLR